MSPIPEASPRGVYVCWSGLGPSNACTVRSWPVDSRSSLANTLAFTLDAHERNGDADVETIRDAVGGEGHRGVGHQLERERRLDQIAFERRREA